MCCGYYKAAEFPKSARAKITKDLIWDLINRPVSTLPIIGVLYIVEKASLSFYNDFSCKMDFGYQHFFYKYDQISYCIAEVIKHITSISLVAQLSEVYLDSIQRRNFDT